MAHSSDFSGRREMTNGWGHPPHPHPHNGGQAGGSHTATHYMQKKQHHRHRGRSSSPMGRVILINAPVDGGDESEDIHTVTVDKSSNGRLGFSVRGGSEHGLGIFVSKVEDNSSAEQAGLCVGDKLVEVNGISLESITMSSAVKVLTGNNRLRMVVRRVGKVPGIRYSKEKTTWVDLIHRRMVVEESGRTPSEASSDSAALRRIIHLYTTSDDYCLGFNIRGGKEFGLGIYVSKMDPGGLAEQHGLKMGDQIVAANGVSFDDITHSNAVEVLKSHTHIMLTIREVGRYPAYKEMVAEYSWLSKMANGNPPSSSQGSDSYSSGSSLSSGTPISSLSGLSQVLFPPIFGSDMVDVCISTEDRLSRGERTAETSMQTDPCPQDRPDLPSSYTPPLSPRLVATETSRTIGATMLLKDTVIRGKGEGPVERGEAGNGGRSRARTLSAGDQEVAEDSRKTSVLMALSRPRRALRRSQSHITVTDKKRGGRPFQLLSSLRETPAGVRDDSTLHGPETLQQVEDMARKLLNPDEVIAVMRHCRRFVSERVVEGLVCPLLAILDRPEKLLLLREIRMLILPADVGRFDSLVMPFELEAYDILKSRSLRSPALRSPRFGTPRRHLITPIPDSRGGFLLQPAQDRQLPEDLERLRVSGPPHTPLVPPSYAFTPLLDVPVDSYPLSALSPHSRSPSPRNWYLTESSYSAHRGSPGHAPHRRDNSRTRYADTSSLSVSERGDAATERGRREVERGSGEVERGRGEVERGRGEVERGRSPVRNSQGRSRSEANPERRSGRSRQEEEVYAAEVSVHVPPPPPLAQVFDSEPPWDRSPSTGRRRGGGQVNGHSQNGYHGYHGNATTTPVGQEYEIATVIISKAKPSLGISISGGMESRVQPMVKIEKIFPGGAASTNEVLKAGCELVSVDGESLQGVTHQYAVEVIRRAFANKARDTLVFLVKFPKGPAD